MADKILAKQIFDDIMSGDETVGKIFYLHFVCDMKLEEVANRLDMRLSTVKTKLYRTMKSKRRNSAFNAAEYYRRWILPGVSINFGMRAVQTVISARIITQSYNKFS